MLNDEYLDSRERIWRAKSQLVSVAAETLPGISPDQREEALTVLGARFGRVWPGLAAERLLRRWPAVHVIATTSAAVEHYARGTFWPKLARVLNVNNTPQFQTAWGEAFLENLEELGLPTFDNDDDAGSRYVGRILLHCGMPTYCLGDFFKILSWKRAHTPGLTPGDFIAWAAGKAAGSGFTSVDMPVQRFVRYGDEFAVDIADRCFELLDAVVAGGQVDDSLLPRRFWDAAKEFDERRGIEPASGSQTSGLSTNLRPRLVLDAYGQGLLLRLPPVGDAPDGRAVWVVTLDGDVQRVTTDSLWPGSTEPAPQTDVAITHPVRAASVALAGREHLQFPIMVIDDQNPLLAFGEDGELIPASLPMPAARTWLLLPGELSAMQVAGSTNIVTESALPPRWSGFCLVQVDLTDATSVTVRDVTRSVRKFDAARIETGDPVAGVRTAAGLPVVGRLPRIAVPASMANAQWDATLYDAEGTVVSRSRTSGADDPNRLWDDVPRPLVGTYSLKVRGPWGRGASRTFAIVEGLNVAFTPTWRHFVAGGLQPCVATLRVADGVQLPLTRIEFGEREREHTVRVSAHARHCSLNISPPHMTVAYQGVEASVRPTIRPLALSCEQIREHPGELVLDIGAAAEPVVHALAHGRVVQTVGARQGRAGVYRFDLAQLVDTLREEPQLSLSLSDGGELVIATIRPQTLFRGIELEGDGLRFGECVDVEGLTAHVFALRAPWREPASLPVVHGHARLPEWLIDAGPLRVIARIEDPWITLAPPGWSDMGPSSVVEVDGWIVDADAEEVAISRFLAGTTALPTDIEDLTRLWTVRALLPRLSLGSRIEDVENEIDKVIYARPAPALRSLSKSDIPIDLIPRLMIRSGLAWANLSDAHEDTPPPWTRHGALPAALLCAADSLWSAKEIESAITVCGESVNGILDGKDPNATSGCLDEAADLMDSNPGLREQWVRSAGLVPQGLLSADSRVLAAMQFVERRRNPWLKWLVSNGHRVLHDLERLMRIIGHLQTASAFSARVHPTREGGWHVIPAISMGYALAARHASRGHAEAGRWIIRQQRAWADLSEIAPDLVTIDLIIAELTVGRREADTQAEQ